MTKFTLRWISIVLGFGGVVICIVALVITSVVSQKLHQLSEKLFHAVDKSLITLEERSERINGRLDELKFTSQDIERSVKNWTKAEVGDRIGSKLDLEQKFEKANVVLGQVDHFLELSESSVTLVQQTLHFASSLGVSVETDLAVHIQEEIVTSREQLASLAERLESAAKVIADDEADLDSERFERLIKVTARLVATVSSLDERVTAVNVQLQTMHLRALDSRMRIDAWINLANISMMLMAVWMAVGQGSLCYIGWTGLRQPPSEQ